MSAYIIGVQYCVFYNFLHRDREVSGGQRSLGGNR